MQEVIIPPRDVYLHFINVSQPNQTLLWWFSTSKKSVQFGLYFKRQWLGAASRIVVDEDGSATEQVIDDDLPITTTTVSRSITEESGISNAVMGASVATTSERSKSYARHLEKQDLVELLPVRLYDSSKTTVKGSYEAKELGTYVLCFDNLFSMNTSKKLTFFAALKRTSPSAVAVTAAVAAVAATVPLSTSISSSVSQPQLSSTLLPAPISGYLMKKKRKRMQGWAKRWFEIDRGVMSYSMEPGGIQRGSIHLPMAAVSTNPVQLTITVDSGATLFQIKALDRPDYEKWVGALKMWMNQPASTWDVRASITGDHQPVTSVELSSSTSSNGAPAVELQRQSTSSQRTSSVVFSGPAGTTHGLSNLANIVSLHQRTITEGHTSFGVEATRMAQLLDVLESQLSEASIVPLASTTPTPTATANTTATAASGISQSSGRSGRKGISSFFSSRPRESTTPVPASSTPPSLPSSGASPPPPSITPTPQLTLASSPLHMSASSTIRQLRDSLLHLQQIEDWMVATTNDNLQRIESGLRASGVAPGQVSRRSTSRRSTFTGSQQQQLQQPLSPVVPGAGFGVTGQAPPSPFLGPDDVMLAAGPASAAHSNADLSSVFSAEDDEEFYDANEMFINEEEDTISDYISDADGDAATTDFGDDDDDGDNDDDDEGDEDDDDREETGRVKSNGLATHAITSGDKDLAIALSSVAHLPHLGAWHSKDEVSTRAKKALTPAVAVTKPPSKAKAPEPEPAIPKDIVRRIKLPSPVFCEPPSIVSILRKNVGRDLFSVSMPVALNEPLNVLQHLCEELEHSYLLDRAATLCDSLERMIFIAAFAISPCAATAFRSSRKPYNPLHGETYECLRPDKGFRFLAEKISHAPPIMACHASSLTASGFGSWEFYQESRAKNKFWGKSMEFIQGGTVHIKLSGWNDHYTFTKPSMWVRNMMSATSRSIEYSGDVVVRNHTTGDVCTIRFKESGYFSSSNNEVTAKIERGKKPLGSSPTPPSSMIVVPANGGGTPATRTLAGRWSENLSMDSSIVGGIISSPQPASSTPSSASDYTVRQSKPVVVDGLGGGDVIWAAHPIPHDPNTYYGFTQFAMELNELVPDIEGTGGNLLPRTDTRLRPDQRMLERGDLDGAEKEKARLETRQRERRKEIEDSGKAWKPRWFVVKKDDNDIGNQDETTWRYAGGYWEAREKHNFGNDILELW